MLIDFLYSFFSNTPHMFFTSNNFLLSREEYLDTGGFDTSFSTSAGEDREFCVRWSCLGGELKYQPDALIYHEHDLNLSGFIRLHFKYGRAAVMYRQKVKAIGMQEEIRIGKFFQSLSKFLSQLERDKKNRLSLALLIILSQLAGTFGSIFQLGYCKLKKGSISELQRE